MPKTAAPVDPEVENPEELDPMEADEAEVEETDWEKEAEKPEDEQDAKQRQVALNLEAIMALPEVEARIANVAAAAAAQAVAQAMGLNTPAKAMTSKVHDRFITEANGTGPVLRHFRCDNAMAIKIIEFDMAKMKKYESGELPIPEDKDSGRPRSIRSLCSIPGKYITFIDGHCYAYTENQVEQILWQRDLPPEQGGMPTIYEDFGGSVDWTCQVCTEPRKVFHDRATWEDHMLRTHGVAPGANIQGAPPVVAGRGF